MLASFAGIKILPGEHVSVDTKLISLWDTYSIP